MLNNIFHNPHEILQVISGYGKRKTEKEVIVDVRCATAVLRGSDIFIQGVLASSTDIGYEDTVSVYCDVHSQCLKGTKPPFHFAKVYLGNGKAKFQRKELFSSLSSSERGIGVSMTEPIFCCPSLNNFLPELVFAQNLPSSVCVHVLDPQPGEYILDMCSAPGGKLTHIGTLMRNTGTLIGLDKARKKLETIHRNLQLCGVTHAKVFVYDSSQAVSEDADPQEIDQSPPYPPESFDKILLDAPCSALGQRPSLYNSMTAKELLSYPKLQKKLLATAAKLLKPKGCLVYSTCTITESENEDQVSWFLRTWPNMRLESQVPYLISGKQFTSSSISADHQAMIQRFHPAWINNSSSGMNEDTIGFFIAKFIKLQNHKDNIT